MSVFFYRGWLGNPENPIEDLRPTDSIYFTRWGYMALLGVTMVAGLVLNAVYLLGYLICPRALIQVPHIAIAGLALRDLMVCLIIIPTAMDWVSVGLSKWNGGEIWCGTAVFFDFYLSSVYPLLLISLCLILYTRKLPPKPSRPPSREPQYPVPSSRMSGRSGYTQRSHLTNNVNRPASRTPSRPASTTGSIRPSQAPSNGGVGGGPVNPNNSLNPDFRRGFSKANSREPSIAGSERGSYAGGRGRSNNQFLSPPHSGTRAASPLRMVSEEYAASEAEGDLWEAASLDYPGREDMDMYEEEDEDEPRLREWLWFLVPLSYCLALGFGLPAATNTNTELGFSPGCYLEVSSLSNQQLTLTANDPGTVLMVCYVILTYIVMGAVLLFLCLLLCTTRWTKDGKLNRFYKMCVSLCIFFVAIKTPIDTIQFRDLVYLIDENTKIVSRKANEIEVEVLLIWSTVLPVIANPVIYLSCVSEYRQNIVAAWNWITGKKGDKENFVDNFDDARKETMETDVL